MSTVTRILLVVGAVGVFLVGSSLFVQHQLESGRWSPPITAMISLTVANVACAISVVMIVIARRKKKRERAAAKPRTTLLDVAKELGL